MYNKEKLRREVEALVVAIAQVDDSDAIRTLLKMFEEKSVRLFILDHRDRFGSRTILMGRGKIEHVNVPGTLWYAWSDGEYVGAFGTEGEAIEAIEVVE